MDTRINALSLQQLSKLEYILLGDLRDVLEEEANEQNRKWLLAIVEALLETVPREFALRCQGGYMQDVLMMRPQVDADVRELKREQQSLCQQLSELHEKLRDRKCFQNSAEVLKQDLEVWSHQLQRHNCHEEDLVQDAYLEELGGGD